MKITLHRQWNDLHPGIFPGETNLDPTYRFPTPGKTQEELDAAEQHDKWWFENNPHRYRRARGVNATWPFTRMWPGESIYVTARDGADKAIRAAASFSHFARRKGRRVRFTHKSDAYGGVRIWRSE